MTAYKDIITIFGGNGFVGRHFVRLAAKQGWRVRIATRVPLAAYELRTNGAVGQIVAVGCDYNDPQSIANAVKGSRYVVNLTGSMDLRGKKAFMKLHRDVPSTIAQACRENHVERFVHVSALVSPQSKSLYAQSKLAGEQAAYNEFAATTILRPSIIFGAGDGFYGRFSRLLGFTPALPLIGGGKARFQPVHVDDVAEAILKSLTLPPVAPYDPRDRVYELAGPEVVTMKDVYQKVLELRGVKRLLLPLPFCAAKFMAFFLQFLPQPLNMTADQVESLKTDSVPSGALPGFNELVIAPTAPDLILPTYLLSYTAKKELSAEGKPA